jgi:homopolymeric O-antigen transport system ATP-binding protein
MTKKVISVEHLSKRYFVGHRSDQGKYTALRDVLVRESRNFIRKGLELVQGRQVVQGDAVEEFWALRDINFEVNEGEVIGIIGRNGSGKSTLLKILSRITDPTEGKVVLRGRVASLLEVGTGFHNELTGRENIFLNGAILGMTQREIRKKFDEIVAFADVDRFLDTPVKRYSSGMYVRLAFAVAAHLEPDILVVDEVLAVGDAEFQKKCLGKMRDVSEREGRTVLFVSHNLAAIADLTNRAIFLNSGTLVADGDVKDVISSYLSQISNKTIYETERTRNASLPHLKRVEVVTSEPNGIHQSNRSLEVRVLISHQQPMSKACLSVVIVNQFQNSVVQVHAYFPEVQFGNKPGETLLICRFPSLRLNVGHYYLRTHLTEPPGLGVYETLSDLCPFEVIRIDDSVLWGWNPSTCAYFEDYVWTVETGDRAPLSAEVPASG